MKKGISTVSTVSLVVFLGCATLRIPEKPSWIETPPPNCAVGIAKKTENKWIAIEMARQKGRLSYAQKLCQIFPCKRGIDLIGVGEKDYYVDEDYYYALMCQDERLLEEVYWKNGFIVPGIRSNGTFPSFPSQ